MRSIAIRRSFRRLGQPYRNPVGNRIACDAQTVVSRPSLPLVGRDRLDGDRSGTHVHLRHAGLAQHLDHVRHVRLFGFERFARAPGLVGHAGGDEREVRHDFEFASPMTDTRRGAGWAASGPAASVAATRAKAKRRRDMAGLQRGATFARLRVRRKGDVRACRRARAAAEPMPGPADAPHAAIIANRRFTPPVRGGRVGDTLRRRRRRDSRNTSTGRVIRMTIGATVMRRRRRRRAAFAR